MQIHRKKLLDHADYTAPTRKHELDLTEQKHICPNISRWPRRDRVDHEVATNDVSDLCEAFHRGKQGERAHHISWSDDFRFDAVVQRRTVGTEGSHRVDVGKPVSTVKGCAVCRSKSDARFPRRSSTDRENVLRDRRAAYGANRAPIVDVPVVAGCENEQVLRVLSGGAGTWSGRRQSTST